MALVICKVCQEPVPEVALLLHYRETQDHFKVLQAVKQMLKDVDEKERLAREVL